MNSLDYKAHPAGLTTILRNIQLTFKLNDGINSYF